MVIFFFKDIKTKIYVSLVMAFLWAVLYFGTSFVFQKILVQNITVNNLFSFSINSRIKIKGVFTGYLPVNEIAVNANALEYKSYSSLKGKFTFLYPAIFILDEKYFPESEILYHIDFTDNNSINGFVQVWKLPYSLKDFLDKSIENSTLNYKSFKSTAAAFNNKQGYLWDYIVISDSSNQNNTYRALEYFFDVNGRMYRISIFTLESMWSTRVENIFMDMVNSFEVL